MNRIRQFLLRCALFQSTRLLIGAVHVLYLVERGVTLSEVALLQIVFSTTVLIAEYPTGVIADAISHKASVLGACCCGALFFVCALFAPNMWILSLGEFSYGCMACLMSGAVEAWLTTLVREESRHKRCLEYYFHLASEYCSIGGIAAGALGALYGALYPAAIAHIYLGGAMLMLLCFFLFLFVQEPRSTEPYPHSSKRYSTIIRSSVRSLIQSSYNRWYVSIACVFVALFQPLFHYWQPFVLDIARRHWGDALTTQSAALFLGSTFCLYSGVTYLVTNRYRAWILGRSNVVSIIAGLHALAAVFISMCSFVTTLPTVISIALFSCLIGFASLSRTIAATQFYHRIPIAAMASTISGVGALSRVAGIIMLAGLHLYVNQYPVRLIFLPSAVLLVVAAALVWVWQRDAICTQEIAI